MQYEDIDEMKESRKKMSKSFYNMFSRKKIRYLDFLFSYEREKEINFERKYIRYVL